MASNTKWSYRRVRDKIDRTEPLATVDEAVEVFMLPKHLSYVALGFDTSPLSDANETLASLCDYDWSSWCFPDPHEDDTVESVLSE